MKKLIAFVCCLLFLNGCAKSYESDLPQTVNDLLLNQNSMEVSMGANHTKKLYKYYLPLDIGIRESTQLGEAFIKNESIILLNFDPSSIVIHEYYGNKNIEIEEQEQEKRKQAREDGQTVIEDDTTIESEKTVDPIIDTQTTATTELNEESLTKVNMDTENGKVTYQGTYKNIQDAYYPYTLKMIPVDNRYIIYFDTSIAQFYCVSPIIDVQSDINSMLLIAKSISYDTEVVLENFSLKKATSSKQESAETLQQNLPSVGSIPDLIKQMEQLNGN